MTQLRTHPCKTYVNSHPNEFCRNASLVYACTRALNSISFFYLVTFSRNCSSAISLKSSLYKRIEHRELERFLKRVFINSPYESPVNFPFAKRKHFKFLSVIGTEWSEPSARACATIEFLKPEYKGTPITTKHGGTFARPALEKPTVDTSLSGATERKGKPGTYKFSTLVRLAEIHVRAAPACQFALCRSAPHLTNVVLLIKFIGTLNAIAGFTPSDSPLATVKRAREREGWRGIDLVGRRRTRKGEMPRSQQ